MDLLQTVRKEGSRGGVNFSWSDVKTSAHRQNYLGHSVMAPVGRWQANRDLNWYASDKNGDADADSNLEAERLRAAQDEKRLIKEREEDEMRRVLGLPAIERGDGSASANANLEPLGQGREGETISASEEKNGCEMVEMNIDGAEGQESDVAPDHGRDRGRHRGLDHEHVRHDERTTSTERDATRDRDRHLEIDGHVQGHILTAEQDPDRDPHQCPIPDPDPETTGIDIEDAVAADHLVGTVQMIPADGFEMTMSSAHETNEITAMNVAITATIATRTRDEIFTLHDD